MATAIRTINHEDRLSLIEHLEELRTRLIVSVIALAVAFGFCLWQNHALLHIINKPLEAQTKKKVAKGEGTPGQVAITQKALIGVVSAEKRANAVLAAAGSGLKPATATALASVNREFDAAVAKIPRVALGDQPVTLGIGEPFTTTITVTFYFALLLSLPIILFQLYGFVLPAFSPNERKLALPLMMAIPFLFAVGVTFGYFIVLPASVRFFQNFNSSEFNVLVQAGPYLKFAALILLAMGLIFQVPVGILAATRAGLVTPRQLRANRRYAVVIAAVIAALLPGDAVTMLLETAPLIVLYEISIRLAAFVDRRAQRSARAAAAAPPAPVPTAPPASAPPPPSPSPPPAPPPVAPVAPTAQAPPPVPPVAPPPLIPPIAPPIRPTDEEDDDAL